jgi:hypothetical protein
MIVRTIRCVFVAALIAASAPALAQARVSVQITSLRVITANDRRPASAPFSRDTAYLYVVRYRIAGEPTMKVSRRARVLGPGGRVVAEVRPPGEVDESGKYFASARIPIGATDPRATYVLRYEVRVRGAGSSRDRAVRILRLPFR